jgi:hypothetical protein
MGLFFRPLPERPFDGPLHFEICCFPLYSLKRRTVKSENEPVILLFSIFHSGRLIKLKGRKKQKRIFNHEVEKVEEEYTGALISPLSSTYLTLR